MFGADVRMIERLRFLARKRQHFFNPRGVGNVPDHLGFRSGADLFLDFHADSLKVEAHLLQNIDGHALAQLDQARATDARCRRNCG